MNRPRTAEAQDALRRYVVGQERASVSLSRLIDMHLAWFRDRNPLHRAPNALLIGPTGTGKSHAIRMVANAMKIPLIVVDSTRLVSAGANDHLTLEGVLINLVKKARQSQSTDAPELQAERGIVFLDEFDKLRYDTPFSESASIQRRLLQFIEGDTLDLSVSEEDGPRSIVTNGILFIAAGAFSGIERLQSRRPMTGVEDPVSVDVIHPRDVREYGFLHELVARLPVIIRFAPLRAEELMAILEHEDVSPLKFYRSYFEQHGFNIHLPEATLRLVAKQAEQIELGARGLHQELFPALSTLADHVIGSPPTDIVITAAMYRDLRNNRYKPPYP
ncbi:AAA family ATPase [Catellatospora coxensis]|uniref:ATP-dependent Clp protease ATP-binding subunit ClpX n=1 Tax=Catellatospora coxensis TaxID=310354 RepID=A0A8J3KYN4_9ACTN|nr:AAA family ATPase [Catellatospora coxensis]GIG04495.1 ATP-dependent Clp protease ATP-binding subunit ClpX [Catellatospora coxensis]